MRDRRILPDPRLQVCLIRGYKKDKIDYPAIRYYENPDYESNNILCSLFCAEQAITGDVVVGYSDILFESAVVGQLLRAETDISIVVDVDWKEYYVGREHHPIGEAEGVVFDELDKVVNIGKISADGNDLGGEFIGMMKLTPSGAETFKRHFHRARARYRGKPFQRAKVFEKAYLTDMIQELVDLGVAVHCVTVRGGRENDDGRPYHRAAAGNERADNSLRWR